MPLGFCLFRQMLCGTLSITSGLSIILGIYLSNFFIRKGVAWLLVGVEMFSFLRSLWSIIRKPMFRTPQSVASECVGLFVLFPFQLIIILLLFAVVPGQGRHVVAFLLLRVFAISSAIIHIMYTIALVSMAILTVPAFDADVWLRDIDSSPSPFPFVIIFAFACPCIARRFEATRGFVQDSTSQNLSSTHCLSTCPPACSVHNNVSRMDIKPSSVESSMQVPEAVTPESVQAALKRALPVLPHTLIRIPNAAERRASIYVDLQIGPEY